MATLVKVWREGVADFERPNQCAGNFSCNRTIVFLAWICCRSAQVSWSGIDLFDRPSPSVCGPRPSAGLAGSTSP